jgi:hypothetical protein
MSGAAAESRIMADFLSSFVLELLIETPGAFVLKVLMRKKTVNQVLIEHEVLSIAAGIVCWAVLVSVVKFIIYGCVLCGQS